MIREGKKQTNKQRKEFGEPMKRKSVLLLTSVVLAAMLLGGCGKEDESANASILDDIEEETVEAEEPEVVEETETEAEEEEEIPEGMYRSELTNEWIDESLKNQRPIAAMVDNEKTALPHFGLSDADVVYEIMNSTKNGRITRLMAVVKDWGKIEQLGSIRSTRPTNILLAAEWNAVLCHDGGPFYIDPYLANDYSAHFSGGFDRVNNGKAREFTEYICTGNLDSKFGSSNYSTEYDKFYAGKDVEDYQHFNFSDDELTLEGDGVIDATEISLPFSHNQSTLKYNADTQTYDYYEYGSVHVDAGNDNKVLTFKNVLIQNCTFHQYDENGYMIYNCIDASNRDGYYVTNGKAMPITWAKTGDAEPTRYFDKDGNEITINTGKTYITLVPDDGWKDMSIK